MTDRQHLNAKLFLELLRRSNIDPMTRWNYRQLKADGYIPLSIDRQGNHPNGGIMFALAHNVEQNGDLMADPDMGVILFNGPEPRLQAIHYQNDFAGFFDSVDKWEGRPDRQAKAQKEMDEFLTTWLRNLLEQGHVLDPGSAK